MALVAATQARGQTDSPAAQLTAGCAACHRLDTRSNGMPPLVSLSSDMIIAMMRAYKARPRSSPIMHVVSSALSDAEIVAVAGYLSRLTRKPGR